MADALSAISLLLTAFAVLFGLWKPKAEEALRITPMPHRVSRGDQIDSVRAAFWRMVGLLFLIFVVAGIFAPRAAGIGIEAITNGGQYDDLRTAFVAAELILIGFFLLVFWTVLQLGILLSKLKSDAVLEPET